MNPGRGGQYNKNNYYYIINNNKQIYTIIAIITCVEYIPDMRLYFFPNGKRILHTSGYNDVTIYNIIYVCRTYL